MRYELIGKRSKISRESGRQFSNTEHTGWKSESKY